MTSRQGPEPMTYAERAEKKYGTAPDFGDMSDVDAVWLACAIDGEGSISICRGTKGRPHVKISMGNTNFDFVRRFADLVRGFACVSPRLNNHKRNPKHRPCFEVSVNNRAIAPLLRRVRPFLVIKGRQADLAIQFRKVVEESLVGGALDHEVYEHLHLECKALNKRGM